MSFRRTYFLSRAFFWLADWRFMVTDLQRARLSSWLEADAEICRVFERCSEQPSERPSEQPSERPSERGIELRG